MNNPTKNPDGIVKIGDITLNLTEMGKDLGISISHLSNIFSGKRGLSIRTAQRIANYLNISLDQLFNLIEEKV